MNDIPVIMLCIDSMYDIYSNFLHQIIHYDPLDPDVLEVQKFDTESVLDILDSEHQKTFWKANQQQITTSGI